ncbi:MAG: metallophosphoesterase [Defluviitaleaceae bacterium]|nr:metallophosphoesterase [Defluviitaleaceae bacterium]
MIKIALTVGASIALIHAIHAATLDRSIEYKEIPFRSKKIPAEMNGYRIAFVTDTHSISEARLQGVVDVLNTKQIDLLLLGGDFASTMAKMQKSIELLSQVVTIDGIFGVEGNHDNYQQLFAAMRAHNITPLSNSGTCIRKGLYLAGVEDLRRRNPNVAKAIAGACADDFVVLISHNPDVAMDASQNTTGVDLILSGHTHGGHITFFGQWAPALPLVTDYGNKFAGGWAKSRDNTPVFVSRGVGGHFPRVFARPQVVLVTLLYN